MTLRGSLAAGTADAFSDIDILWSVPDERFAAACDDVSGIVAAVGPVSSLRIDPEAGGPSRRLVFVRLSGLPLFWRLDLEIRSQCHDERVPEPPAEDAEWSHTHSALMCAIAAIKALLRGRPEEGAKLVSKGFERIHIPVPAVTPRQQILALADTIYDADDSQAELAVEVRQLYHEAFDAEP